MIQSKAYALAPLRRMLPVSANTATITGRMHNRSQPIKLKPKQNSRHLFPSIICLDSVIASLAVISGCSANMYGAMA